MFHAIQVHHVKTTRWATDGEILDAVVVTLTTLVQTHRQINGILNCVVFSILIPFNGNGDMEPTATTRPAFVSTPIVSEANRKCAILPFLFGERPSNNAIPSHAASTPRDPYQHLGSQHPLYCNHLRWYPWNSHRRHSPTELSSIATMQRSMDASNMHH